MYKLTIEGKNFEEFKTNFYQYYSQVFNKAPEQVRALDIDVEEIKPKTKTKAKPKKEEPVAEELSVEDIEIDYATEVRPLLLKIGEGDSRLGLGRDTFEKLCKKFGAKNGVTLKPEDYPAVIKEANKILESAGAEDYA